MGACLEKARPQAVQLQIFHRNYEREEIGPNLYYQRQINGSGPSR